jgi:protein ImuA
MYTACIAVLAVMPSASLQARQALMATLRRKVEKLEGAALTEDERPVSTGCLALDRLLPAGGLRRGTLVEYLTSVAGRGASTLALSAAREACSEGRALVVLDIWTLAPSANEGKRQFYPPAATGWGIDLSRLLVLRPASKADALWAMDQALRCPAVGAVWSTWDQPIDVRDFRRLQLAAECGQAIGLLCRPARLRGQPTWADVQWLVETKSKVEGPRSKVGRHSTFDIRHSTWQLRVELVRCRGAAGGQTVYLELDESAGVWREVSSRATHSLSVPAQLAHSTTARRA